MKKMWIVCLVVLILLSVAASLPKLLRVAQEVAFFRSVGLPESVVLVFGLLQLAGGILLVFEPTRGWGAAVAGVLFLCSAIMVLLSGNLLFALVSLLPVLLAAFVMKGSMGRAARGAA